MNGLSDDATCFVGADLSAGGTPTSPSPFGGGWGEGNCERLATVKSIKGGPLRNDSTCDRALAGGTIERGGGACASNSPDRSEQRQCPVRAWTGSTACRQARGRGRLVPPGHGSNTC